MANARLLTYRARKKKKRADACLCFERKTRNQTEVARNAVHKVARLARARGCFHTRCYSAAANNDITDSYLELERLETMRV